MTRSVAIAGGERQRPGARAAGGGTAYRSSASARNEDAGRAGRGRFGDAVGRGHAGHAAGRAGQGDLGETAGRDHIVGAAAAVPGYYAWQRHQSAEHGAGSAVALAGKPIAAADATPSSSASLGAAGTSVPTGAPLEVNDAPAHFTRSSVTLAHELSSIDAARGLLARGDAVGALAGLDAYGRAYPHGRLGLEAEVLRIDALYGSGRADVARARAEAFLQRHPHNVLAAHVRTRLGD